MEKNARKLLAQNIRVLRFKRGWTQEQVSHESGLHRTYITLIEGAKSNVGIDQLDKLAHAFGISIRELFDRPLIERARE